MPLTPRNPAPTTADHSDQQMDARTQTGAVLRSRANGKEYKVSEHPGGPTWRLLTRRGDNALIVASVPALTDGNYDLVQEGGAFSNCTFTDDAPHGIHADTQILQLERALADANARIRNLQQEWNLAADLSESRRQRVKELEGHTRAARIKELQDEWNALKHMGDRQRQRIKELEDRIKELTLYSASLEQGNGALFAAACGLEIKENPLLPENVIVMRDPPAGVYRIAGFIVPEAWLAHQHATDECYGNDSLCTAHLGE